MRSRARLWFRQSKDSSTRPRRRRKDPLSWFFQIDRATQAALLARPHGYLPDGMATAGEHVVAAHHNENRQRPRRWLLRSTEANLLEEERLRLDSWWGTLSQDEQASFIEYRDGRQVPHEHRSSALSLLPAGAAAGDGADLDVKLPKIAVAYLEMQSSESIR